MCHSHFSRDRRSGNENCNHALFPQTEEVWLIFSEAKEETNLSVVTFLPDSVNEVKRSSTVYGHVFFGFRRLSAMVATRVDDRWQYSSFLCAPTHVGLVPTKNFVLLAVKQNVVDSNIEQASVNNHVCLGIWLQVYADVFFMNSHTSTASI